MGTPQERKFQRFNLSYPVRVKFRSGDSTAEIDVVSRNISIGGLLLESGRPISLGSPIEFMITLTGPPMSRSITLEGAGRVVRLEKETKNKKKRKFGIAVACAQPVAQIEDYLSAASKTGWVH